MTIKIIILSIPYLFEVIRESYWFIKLHKADNHKATTWIRFFMMLGAALIVSLLDWDITVMEFVTYFCISGAIHFTLFNYTLNLARRWIGNQKWVHLFYLGDTVIDNWLKTWCPVIGSGFVYIVTLFQVKLNDRIGFKIGYVMAQAFVLFGSLGMIPYYT